ncbi:hypothetical protein V565_202600, partial [Rhizoctonia solani 123E]
MSLAHHRSQLLRNHKAQITPISTIRYSIKARNEPSLTNKLSSSVLGQGAPGLLRPQPGNVRGVEIVSRQLSYLGVKTRYDWDTRSHTKAGGAPTELHELPGVWFLRCAMPLINEKLSQTALCGRPSLVTKGSVGLRVGGRMGEGQKGVVPDESLYLAQIDSNGDEIQVQGAPRLIIETAGSESRRHVIEKVFEYFFEMIGVQTAVICDLTNVPPQAQSTSDARPAKAFKAEIAVWTRKATGFVDLDYPLDRCYHREELGGHKLGQVIPDTSYLYSKATPAAVCHLVPG